MIRQLPDPATGIAASMLLGALAWSPLPYGSVLPRDRLILELAGFLALAAVVAFGREPAVLRAAARPALAIAGVGLFGLVQSWTALSAAPGVSRSVAFVWLAAAAALAAAACVSRDRRLRRALALTLLAAVVFEIGYGTHQLFEGSTEIWGRGHGVAGRLRGTFVNPDHFAMYLGVALAAGFALTWWSMRRARWLPLERRLLYVVLPWMAFVVIFVALALSGSRAGLMGGVAAVLVQASALAVIKRRWQASLSGLAAVAAGLAAVLYLGWQQGMGRWIATSAYEITWNARREVYRHSLELWWQSPWTGTGLGTFRQAFPAVQPAELELSWFHAHSDVLELLVTTGGVGPLLLVWGLAALLRRLWRNLRHGHRSEDRAVALAALGVLTGVLVHSCVDFGLTLPANAFVTVVALGLGCGVAIRPPRPDPAT